MKHLRRDATTYRTVARCGRAPGLVAGLLLLCGCGSGGINDAGLSPDAFRAGPERTATVASGDSTPRPIVQPAAAGQTPVDITTRVGGPALDAAPAGPAGDPVLIDCKIGDINGHPVWASDFFDDLFSAHLRADALQVGQGKLSAREWEDKAKEAIDKHLEDLIDNVLIKDEGMASLAPEVKKHGLAAFLDAYRQEQVSKSMGSEVLADRAAQEKKSQYYANLDELTRDAEEQLLIELSLRKVRDSINISSKDKRRFYSSNPDVFDPAPVACFSMILVPAGAPADAALARWALEEGVPFADVASLPLNLYKPDQEGQMEGKPFRSDYADATFFDPPQMASAARSLRPGEWTGPFYDSRGSATFLRLDRIVRGSVSLFDAQLAIEAKLHQDRYSERVGEKIARLKRRSSLTDPSQMSRRLLEIAKSRFLPQSGG